MKIDTFIKDAPRAEQAKFWKNASAMATLAFGISLAGASAIAYTQRDGGPMDLHRYVDPYVERSVRDNPSLNRDQFRIAAKSKADLYENSKVGVFLIFAGVSGFAARALRKKAKSIESAPGPSQ